MKMKFLVMLIAAGLLSGCTSWTPEQHMQREENYFKQENNTKSFEISGISKLEGTNITIISYIPVDRKGPIDTTAQTAIKTAGVVGTALINQTPTAVGGIVAGMAIRNPPEQNTSVSDYRYEKSVTDTSSSQISSSTTTTTK